MKKRKSVLLTVCGAQTYSLVRNLCSPLTPKDKTYEEILQLIKGHLSPEPIVIAERFKFHQRKQKDSESVHEFLASLKKMSHANLGTSWMKPSETDSYVD